MLTLFFLARLTNFIQYVPEFSVIKIYTRERSAESEVFIRKISNQALQSQGYFLVKTKRSRLISCLLCGFFSLVLQVRNRPLGIMR